MRRHEKPPISLTLANRVKMFSQNSIVHSFQPEWQRAQTFFSFSLQFGRRSGSIRIVLKITPRACVLGLHNFCLRTESTLHKKKLQIPHSKALHTHNFREVKVVLDAREENPFPFQKLFTREHFNSPSFFLRSGIKSFHSSLDQSYK